MRNLFYDILESIIFSAFTNAPNIILFQFIFQKVSKKNTMSDKINMESPCIVYRLFYTWNSFEIQEFIDSLIELFKTEATVRSIQKRFKNGTGRLDSKQAEDAMQLAEINLLNEHDHDFFYTVEMENGEFRQCTVLEHLETISKMRKRDMSTLEDFESLDEAYKRSCLYEDRVTILYVLCVSELARYFVSSCTKYLEIVKVPPCKFDLMKRMGEIYQEFEKLRRFEIGEQDFLNRWLEIIQECYVQ